MNGGGPTSNQLMCGNVRRGVKERPGGAGRLASFFAFERRRDRAGARIFNVLLKVHRSDIRTLRRTPHSDTIAPDTFTRASGVRSDSDEHHHPARRPPGGAAPTIRNGALHRRRLRRHRHPSLHRMWHGRPSLRTVFRPVRTRLAGRRVTSPAAATPAPRIRELARRRLIAAEGASSLVAATGRGRWPWKADRCTPDACVRGRWLPRTDRTALRDVAAARRIVSRTIRSRQATGAAGTIVDWSWRRLSPAYVAMTP